jgi:hypothetical protein
LFYDARINSTQFTANSHAGRLADRLVVWQTAQRRIGQKCRRPRVTRRPSDHHSQAICLKLRALTGEADRVHLAALCAAGAGLLA